LQHWVYQSIKTIQTESFKKEILSLLDETIENVEGNYLDKSTSLFETLAGLSAAEASIPVGNTSATLTAQPKHTAFYLDVILKVLRDPDFPEADWGEICRTVKQVTLEEWQSSQPRIGSPKMRSAGSSR